MTFNAKASRSKRPCPIWVDAFQRDTQHLEADEIGAYFLILMAMWTRENCDFPDDDNRLARVSRVSVRLWKSRIGPAIREFLEVERGSVISKRLRQEATYVENEVQKQSDRKRGTYAKPQGVHNASEERDENSGKSLKSNKPHSTADITTDEPRNHPSQQPNNPTVIPEADASGRDAPTERENEEFWVNAKQYLGRKGVPERQRGSFIGKMIREHGFGQARDAFRRCQAEGVAEPITWITACLSKATHKPAIDENVLRILARKMEEDEALDQQMRAAR